VRAALFHFLEAQGLDTSGLGAMDLDRYLTGDPVWFRKGSTVVRVPLAGLSKAGAGFKAPPAEVGAAVLRQAGRGGGGWNCPVGRGAALLRIYRLSAGYTTALEAL
jgi:hypothetical protein